MDLERQLAEVARDPDRRAFLDGRLGDYCHQSRNRLNSLKLSLYLARRQSSRQLGPGWRALEADLAALEAQYDQIRTICQPLAFAPVSLPLRLLFDDRRPKWSATLAATGRDLVLVPPASSCLARFDVTLLGAALDGVVDWRSRQNGRPGTTRLAWRVDSGRAEVDWDEGPTPADAASPAGGCPDFHWGLPILIRVVAEHGGDVRVESDAGFRVGISWVA